MCAQHNVLIDDDGSPRLADFAKSRVVERKGFTSGFSGTARYMAPELMDILDEPTFDGENDVSAATLDPTTTKQSDVYAFSMVVLEVCDLYFHPTWCN